MNAVAPISQQIKVRMGVRRTFGSALAAALLMVGTTGSVRADENAAAPADEATLEYQLKAGFLFNFAKFVQWPSTNGAAANPAATNALRIGIVDDGQVFPVVAAALDGKLVNARPIAVSRLQRSSEAAQFDLLFITKTQEKRVPALLKQIGNAPVLTVGESPGFAAHGGCLNFFRSGENLRFEVNLQVAQNAGLKLSSQLAAMAKVVVKAEETK